jgi:hypothetical protein
MNYTQIGVLSSFNGGRFIEAFMNSLELNAPVDFILIYRDDGSCDESRNLVLSYSGTIEIVELPNSRLNLGVTSSYLELLEFAAKFSYNPLVHIFDQDDIVEQSRFAEGFWCGTVVDEPFTIICDYDLIDENGEVIEVYQDRSTDSSILSLLTFNRHPGCCFTVNSSAVRSLLLFYGSDINLQRVINYDWALLLVSCAYGSIFKTGNRSHFYRIHSENTTGINANMLQRGLSFVKFLYKLPLKRSRWYLTALGRVAKEFNLGKIIEFDVAAQYLFSNIEFTIANKVRLLRTLNKLDLTLSRKLQVALNVLLGL